MIRAYMRRLRGISYMDWTGEIGRGLESLKLPKTFPPMVPGDLADRYETNWSPEEILRDWIGTLTQKGIIDEKQSIRAKFDLDWFLLRELARAIGDSPNGIDQIEAEIEEELRTLETDSAAAIIGLGGLLVRDPMPTGETLYHAHNLIAERARANRIGLSDLQAELRDLLLELRDRRGIELYEALLRTEDEIERAGRAIRTYLTESKDSLADDISYTREEVLSLLYRASKETV